MPPITVAFYDSKPYDREHFERAADGTGIILHHHDFRLSAGTASTVEGAQVVCVFVNDHLDTP